MQAGAPGYKSGYKWAILGAESYDSKSGYKL